MTKQDLLSHEPAAVLRYFYELSQIPRESGNEQGVREYLITFAQDHGLWHATDAVGNVVIRKPGTVGTEDAQSIAMQGHMDMVCVKDDDYRHDFAADPIKLQVTGDSLSAEGTTLGADNGIAIAMILAIFDDDTLTHGPLEGIFTVSEETGLDGAFGLDISNVNSRRLINLDSEEEGVFYIGCAGGGEVVGSLEAAWEGIPAGSEAWDITLSGFIGGHSGAEIHTGRGNAIKAGARLLKLLCRQVPLQIASISSGTKRNVIPSTFYCTCILPEGSESLVREAVSTISDALKAELGTADPDTAVTAAEAALPQRAVSAAQSEAVIDALILTPNGVDAMSRTIPGLVETSNNMAVVRLGEGSFSFTSSQRSSILSARDDMEERTAIAFESCGAVTDKVNEYPSWTPNPDSPMAGVCADFYREFTGKEPVVTAIHAGLECGVINSKAEDMDSISFGPDLSGVHSTDEQMSLSSAARVFNYLTALLGHIAKG